MKKMEYARPSDPNLVIRPTNRDKNNKISDTEAAAESQSSHAHVTVHYTSTQLERNLAILYVHIHILN